MSSLVYRLEIQSVMLVFLTNFVNYCPSNLLSGKLSSPFPVWISILYTCVKCVRRVVFGHRSGGGLRQIKHLPQSPFTGHFFRLWHLALLSISQIFLWLELTVASSSSNRHGPFQLLSKYVQWPSRSSSPTKLGKAPNRADHLAFDLCGTRS